MYDIDSYNKQHFISVQQSLAIYVSIYNYFTFNRLLLKHTFYLTVNHMQNTISILIIYRYNTGYKSVMYLVL